MGILPKCDPSLQLVPGTRTPFKNDLFGAALGEFKLLLSDLDMLCLAMTGHEEVHVVEVKETVAEKMEAIEDEGEKIKQEEALFALMKAQPAWQTMVQDLANTIAIVCEMLTVVLAHDSEEPLKDETIDKLKAMERIAHLDGVPQFYEEVSKAQGREQNDEEIFQDQRTVTDYEGQYKGIAQVIIAILLKMLIAQLLAPQQPRDNAMDSLQKLTDAIKATFAIFLSMGEVEHPEVG